MTTVTVHDMRALKYCAHGSRAFAKRYGLDWSRFVRDGMPVSELQHVDDGMLKRVIEQAEKREARNVGK